MMRQEGKKIKAVKSVIIRKNGDEIRDSNEGETEAHGCRSPIPATILVTRANQESRCGPPLSHWPPSCRLSPPSTTTQPLPSSPRCHSPPKQPLLSTCDASPQLNCVTIARGVMGEVREQGPEPPPLPPDAAASLDTIPPTEPASRDHHPLPPPRFDPSRMIGIIRRKSLIKDLAAVYHAECLAYCQELLELQRKWEEPFTEIKTPENSRKETMRPPKRLKKSR
ncbi:hypothetical protein U1Q18_009631 [Sarracenia purpurea var. burkii]